MYCTLTVWRFCDSTYILSSRALYWVQLKKSVYCHPDFVFRIQTTAAGVALDAGYLDIGYGYTFRIPAVLDDAPDPERWRQWMSYR
jgi:hypothetical protein